MGNNFQDTLHGMSRFGKDAYKSGERSREAKDKLRQRIYSHMQRVDESRVKNAADHEIQVLKISEELDKSKAYLEDYIHDFGNPGKVPDFFFDYLETLKSLIKSTDEYRRTLDDPNTIEFEDLGFEDTIRTLADEWNRVAAKIIRLAYELRDPPLQIPDATVMFPPDKNKDSAFR